MSKNNFLSKENITKLYKETVNKTNLNGVPKESKNIIVNMLTSNMKDVFKQINFSKVNDKNAIQILNQFNGICVDETIKNIKTSELFDGEDAQISRLKFQRDFNSGPDRKVQYLERPKTTGKSLHKSKSFDINQQNMSESTHENFIDSDVVSRTNNSSSNYMRNNNRNDHVNNSEFSMQSSTFLPKITLVTN